jgi:cell division control protein 24
MLIRMQELRKQIEDEALQVDITKAIDTIQSVLDSANEAVDKEHLASAVVDLANRVDDWKSLKVEGFGELLRFGTFTVLKGDSTKDTEREVCFLFYHHIERPLPLILFTQCRVPQIRRLFFEDPKRHPFELC